MKTYCLGYTHDKCKTCRHEHNWHMLNSLPNVLRLTMQKSMQRISDDKCRLTNMGEWVKA